MRLLQRRDGQVVMTSSLADSDSARLDDDGAPVRTARQSAPPADVRLAWAPGRSGKTPEGAWWPHSRDATAELSELVPLVQQHLGGTVTRVSLNIDAWGAPQPRRLDVNGRVLRLGWFHTLDPAIVTVARGSDARITLHVVPPELGPTAAGELLREISTGS